jgi:hypothetical protein
VIQGVIVLSTKSGTTKPPDCNRNQEEDYIWILTPDCTTQNSYGPAAYDASCVTQSSNDLGGLTKQKT